MYGEALFEPFKHGVVLAFQHLSLLLCVKLQLLNNGRMLSLCVKLQSLNEGRMLFCMSLCVKLQLLNEDHMLFCVSLSLLRNLGDGSFAFLLWLIRLLVGTDFLNLE